MTMTVCVWAPTPNFTGHAALLCNGLYFSFWPDANLPQDARAVLDTPGGVGQSLQVDIKTYGCHPHLTTTLNNLDARAAGAFLNHFVMAIPSYNVLTFNCCHPVKIAMYEATGRKIPPNFAVRAEPAQYRIPLPPELAGGVIENWARDTWSPVDVHRYAQQLKRQKG